MRKLIILILISCFNVLFALDTVEPQLLQRMAFGSGEDQISYGKEVPSSFYPLKPGKLTISPQNEVYIIDTGNDRIRIYGLDWNLVRVIQRKNEDYLDYTRYAIIDENHILGYARYIYILNSEFDELLKFQLPNQLISGGSACWTYQNYVIFYQDNKPKIIDVYKQRYLDENEVEAFIQKGLNESSLYKNPKIHEKLDEFLDSTHYVLVGDRFLATDVEMLTKLGEYFQIVNTLHNKTDETELLGLIRNHSFIGFDRNNYYFYKPNSDTNYKFYAVRKDGMILSEFEINSMSFYFPAVAPSGDIFYYTIDYDNKQCNFYKIPNTWDPILKSGTSEPPSSTITTTSYIDYKSQYVGSCAFDDNPSTAWLEGHPREGVGEKLSIQFNRPVSIDRIEFMPGYFDEKWFRANNRVRRLRIILDGEVFYTDFEDVMKPQYVMFEEAKTFKKAEFTIVSVYPGKDNDTAISEIAFYLNGEKVTFK